MTNRRTTFDDHDPLAYGILQVLEYFIDEIGERGCTGHFEKVVDGKYRLKGKHLIQKPERFIEDHLVFRILRQALGYSLRPQPKQYAPRWPKGGGIPDFCITSLPIETAMQNDVRFFGEVKAPKKIQKARSDMEDYLDSDLDIHAVAILTDGFEWELWVRPRNRSTENLDNPYATASLRDALKTVRTRNMNMESYRSHKVRNQIDVDGFSQFELSSVQAVMQDEFDIIDAF
ncbi:MAG: hypothetical protein ABEH81_03140 [Halopenitus sp.]